MLARRHKLIEGTASEVTQPQAQQAIARMLRQSDEGALSKLLIEVVFLESSGGKLLKAWPPMLTR